MSGKREPLMTEAYFLEHIRYIDTKIAERDTKLREQPERYVKPMAFLRANFRERYQQVFLGYSVGESTGQLAARLPAVVDAYERCTQREDGDVTDLRDIDDYIVSLWLVSFALLFDANDALWQRLLACIGNEGRDALFDALVATRSPGRPRAGTLLHKAFQPLFDAIAADGPARDALLQRYRRGWYKALRKTYWVETHHWPFDRGFFGYWAVELAGVVAAFDMDDEALLGEPYYPADLLD